MHQKKNSEDPLTCGFYSRNTKREFIAGPLKISKNVIKPISKSEKNSPAGAKSNRIMNFSPTVRKQALPFQFNTPRATESKQLEKNGIKVQNFFKQPEKNVTSGLVIKKIPKRLGEFKSSSMKLTNSEKTLPRTPSKSITQHLSKEKEFLIAFIRKSFVETFSEPQTDDRFYQIDSLLGQGAFGKVLLGRQILTNKKVAIKVFDRSHLLNDYSRHKIFREVYILKKIQSKFVVRIFEIFETAEHFLIVMEYLEGGDLLAYLKKNGRLSEDQSKKFFYQIILGLLTIHKNGILHRDIKLDNILLDKTQSFVKICDFGISKIIDKGEVITDHCGTPAYLAPEIILNKGYEGFWSDIWSLGVLLYCMVCGTVPFKANTIQDLQKGILLGKFDLPECLSANLKHLLRNMLVSVPNKRIPLDKILRHRWFDDCGQMFSEAAEDKLRPNNELVSQMEELGYPRQHVINSLEFKTLNHSYAVYMSLGLKD